MASTKKWDATRDDRLRPEGMSRKRWSAWKKAVRQFQAEEKKR